ncbi:TetR/AcrR family transcriptional regulator [Streptomyces brevispora]|uniref:TetR/AcrR family transcriptional regulator n=1 Tax=Streptomyces brevispora TaxID=887462 RepID=UPI002E379487|nr:TetR/AcrR family transcriptional regulator [Streptomyces brevispora]
MNVSNFESQGKAVPADVVQAALDAARDRGVPVAEVPLVVVAERAGISRSTLLRRLGGRRDALDDAVRAAGVDPGGHEPVRVRAVDAAAVVISERGLAAATLERVAAAAGCSVHSLYASFGGRDELLYSVYERYSPALDVEAVLKGPRADLADTVRAIHRLLVDALSREPRVLPAMMADALARPEDSSVQAMYQRFFPRLLDGVGRWLTEEMAAGRVRRMPLLPLMHQMTGPVLFHFLLRPATEHLPGADLPTPEETIEVFTQTFLRAVATP